MDSKSRSIVQNSADPNNTKTNQNLAARYPELKNQPSFLLQRRLSKNMKYFDSADYSMSKEVAPKPSATRPLDLPTGDTIPTPENIPMQRNKSIDSPVVAGTEHRTSICVESPTVAIAQERKPSVTNY